MGKYSRKSSRQSWSQENMQLAIDAVKKKTMGWQLASKTYNVPFTTLRRRAESPIGATKGYLGGRKATFSKELENELVEHIKILESRFFGLTTLDVRKLAFEIAEAKKIPHRFSTEKQIAGWDWLYGFTQRNPTISLRTPESTSVARAQSFNKVQIETYFERLSSVLMEHSFEAGDIWNVDESGLSTVPSKNVKIFATKGRKQVGVITSAERGQHLTVVCCISAIGTFVPPALIFPRKNMKAELMDHGPPGAIGLTQEKGWMNGEVFLQWLKHFVKFVKPSLEKKVLLVIDGHSSHKSLDVLTYAKQNGVILFCLPPHCTHRAQPLDVSLYGSLRTYYNQELTSWLKNHPGRIVTHFQVAEIFSAAYMKAATVKNATSGFSTTGISPLNPNIFPEWMFAPAAVTDIPFNDAVLTDIQVNGPADNSEQNVTFDQPGPSGLCCNNITTNPTIAEISPLPTAKTQKRSNRRKGKFGVINNTPEIELVKQAVVEKEAVELRKSARAAKKRLKIVVEGSEEERTLDYETDDEDDAACLFCNEEYKRSRAREMWLRCQSCLKWAHSECAGLPRTAKKFVCELCR